MRNKTGRPAGSGSALARIVAAVAVALCLSLTPTLVTLATAETADDGIATLELDEDDYAALESDDEAADDDEAAEASEDDLATTASVTITYTAQTSSGENSYTNISGYVSQTLSVTVGESQDNATDISTLAPTITGYTYSSAYVTVTTGNGQDSRTETRTITGLYYSNDTLYYTYTTTSGGPNGGTTTSSAELGSDTTIYFVYTASSSSNSTDLDITKYLGSSLVLWDMNDSSTDQSYDGTDVYVSSVTLNNTSVAWAESSSVNTSNSETTGYWGSGSALTTYFGDTADGYYYDADNSTGSSTATGDTVSLTITPVAGYYVTSVVIACAPTSGGQSNSSQLTPYSCSTWSSGNATNQTFSDTSGGSVTIDVTNLSFAHTSSSGYYFILITVAPIPSPVYVEYSYGEIVGYLAADGCDTSAFSTTSWTSASGSNVYTYDSATSDGGVQTANVQFKYTYDDYENSTEDASKWKHYANSVSDEAIAAAWADGYVFVGWEVTYYYDMGTISSSTSTGTYENDYTGSSDGSFYNYGGDSGTDGTYNAVGDSVGYPFSSVYGKTFVRAGEEITILNHTYIKAVWIKVESGDGDLLVSKTVGGNVADPDYHFTFTLTSTDTTTTDGTTTYDIDGTYAITFSGIEDCDYTGTDSTSTTTGATAHGSSVSATTTDGTTTYTITFKDGTAELYLADGESALIEDLPSGVTVTVTEDDDFAEDNAYATTTVETSTTTTTVSSETTDDDATEGESEDDSTVTTLAVAADDDGNDDGSGSDSGSDTNDDSSDTDDDSSSTTTSTYLAKVTIPAMTIPSSAITTTVTPVYDDDGDVTDYTYDYTIDWTKCTKSQMNVAFTNTFSLSPDNGAGIGAPVAMAAVLVVAAGGAAALAWSGRRRRVRS